MVVRSFGQSTGKTQVEFAVLAAGQFGRFAVTGNVVLGCALELQLDGTYAPTWGNSWTVLTATTGTVTGAFASVTGDALSNPDWHWWAEGSGNTLRVGVAHVADINHDGAVNTSDLTSFLGQFGSVGSGLSADFNHDGAVNTQDLTRFLGAFGLTAPVSP